MKKPWIEADKSTRGIAPAVILIDPKFPFNVGSTVRAAACFGVKQVWFTGDRIEKELEGRKRLPREERMKGYKEVDLIHFNFPFDMFENVAPVCMEVRENSEPLTSFNHPENAIYVFGPEDGSIGKPILRLCHRFVVIPTKHCVNLAAAVYITLYDRYSKLWKERRTAWYVP
ncbi:MAG: TrmH family RNA methyltransferase [candidate division Zixibacteria bacterium]|nr:TrmH family RNA methyltransferase [candidate division Zixibacteria bacterium]